MNIILLEETDMRHIFILTTGWKFPADRGLFSLVFGRHTLFILSRFRRAAIGRKETTPQEEKRRIPGKRGICQQARMDSSYT